MKKVIVLATGVYSDFPRSVEVDQEPESGTEISVGGESMKIDEVKATPNVDGYDFLITVSGRYNS